MPYVQVKIAGANGIRNIYRKCKWLRDLPGITRNRKVFFIHERFVATCKNKQSSNDKEAKKIKALVHLVDFVFDPG